MRSIPLKASSLITKILRALPAELSHSLALNSLNLIDLLKIRLIEESFNKKPLRLLGYDFQNRIGIAGGLDKNADYLKSLSSLGVSFIEVGTVTPKPQKGNKKPRLFRSRKELALLNRMGFNNKGVLHLVNRIKAHKGSCKLLVSIGRNFDTPKEKAINDYIFCLDHVFPFADIVTINISSPNTEGLRSLQDTEYLSGFLRSLKNKQLELSKVHKYKPLVIKISPDLSKDQYKDIAKIIKEENVDGLITTNTTEHQNKNGKGGLSGMPLYKKSTQVLKEMRKLLGKDFPIIASGGVMDLDTYQGKLDAGADLVQVYTGMIYKGPELIEELLHSDRF